MANVQINQLPAGTTPLDGSELIPVDQGATTVKITTSDIAVLANENSVLNAQGTPQIASDIFSNRPLADLIGSIYIATDTGQIYQYNGSNWITLGGGAGSAIVTTKVSLTSADILNFNGSNYFELIPAQGAGTYINVLKAFYVFNFVTTAYTGGGTVWITMGGLVANITSAVSNCFNQANTVLIRPPMYNSTLITNIYEDTSLELGCSAAQTLGDGTFDVYITYEVINL